MLAYQTGILLAQAYPTSILLAQAYRTGNCWHKHTQPVYCWHKHTQPVYCWHKHTAPEIVGTSMPNRYIVGTSIPNRYIVGTSIPNRYIVDTSIPRRIIVGTSIPNRYIVDTSIPRRIIAGTSILRVTTKCQLSQPSNCCSCFAIWKPLKGVRDFPRYFRVRCYLLFSLPNPLACGRTILLCTPDSRRNLMMAVQNLAVAAAAAEMFSKSRAIYGTAGFTSTLTEHRR